MTKEYEFSRFKAQPKNPSFKLADIQTLIAITVGITGGLTVAGFMLVNLYLSRFGSIQGFSIVTGRYIATSLWFGFSMLIAFFPAVIGWLRYKNIPMPYSAGIAAIGLVIIFFVFLPWVDRRLVPQYVDFNPPLGTLLIIGTLLTSLGAGATIREQTENAQAFKDYITNFSGISIIMFLLLVGLILFSIVIYPHLPQSLGGGLPMSAIFILKEDDAKVLPFIYLTGTAITEPIDILAELNNGYLVHDPTRNLTFIVKHESIQGIIDASRPTVTPTPATTTPEPTLTPVPTLP